MSEVITQNFPFNRLRLSAANVRRNRNTQAYKASVEALASSILAMHKLTGQGLLQNLVVHVVGEFAEVVAGGRRYDALGLLVERGELPDTYPVPGQTIGIEALTAASLSENTQRLNMHPAEEFDAFVQLASEGWTIDRIADSFGVTPLVVERRLKLKAAAPSLLDDFRADLLTTDQLMALCSTDNHDRQISAWSRVRDSHWGKEPSQLRQAVIETEVEAANDSRIAFIGGIEVYEQAGGAVRRDLFASDGQGVILEDSALLNNLVDDRLKAMLVGITNEGWGWTDVWKEMDWTVFYRFGRLPTTSVELSASAAQQLNQLEDQLENVRTSIEGLARDDLNEDELETLGKLEDERDALERQIEEVNEATVSFDPALIEHAGAILIYQRGSVRVERGLVRTVDREKVNALLVTGERIEGGRESEPAGRKADSLSEALRSSLLGYRNLAAQSLTAMNANAAKILLACKFIADVRGSHGVVPSDLVVTNGYGTRTACTISDSAGQSKVAEFTEQGNALIEALPTDPVQLWDALAAMKGGELDKLLAFAVARSVSLSSEADGLSGKYLEALGLDMADHFTPTAENYFGRVSKDLMVEALNEAGKVADDEDKKNLLAMKKGVLAKEAESRMAGTGWVPALIRTQRAEPKAGKLKGGSKKQQAIA